MTTSATTPSILHESLIPKSEDSSSNNEVINGATQRRPSNDQTQANTNKNNNNNTRNNIIMTGPAQTIAGILGNVLEWYDFALFGFFSDVIAQVFFPPAKEGSSNLVKSFALFGAAFIMRPFGGIIIGSVGDKYGRKRGLVLSLFLMAVPTFAMGCLPTYEQVGVLSTVLLVFCRLLQGLSVGGQLPASMIYTIEKKPKGTWGFYGALVMVAANVGTILGNWVGALLRTILTDEELVSWGWRIPFWTGLLIAFVAIYLRLYGEEHNPNEEEYGESSPNNQDGSSEVIPLAKYPLREAIRKENLPALISATLTPMLGGSSFYLTFVWMVIYMDSLMDPPIQHAFWINSMALIFGVTIPLPFIGSLSDKCGRIPIMVTGAVCVGVFGPLILMVISTGNGVAAFFAQFAIGIMLTFYGAPTTAFLIEMFPPKVRLTSSAVGYDIAQSTASAFTPLVATVLFQTYGSKAPGMIYPFFATLSLIGIVLGRAIHKVGGVENETDNDSTTIDKSQTTEASKEEPQLNPIV